MSEREFDVIVWGATGFTGALVCEYLLERYGVGAGLNWAIAARREKKLEALKSELGDAARSLPTLVADSHDRAALDSMAARTRVVLTTVGPYAKYGSELVAACVENGTDYCDLAGEVQWIRRMIDAHEARAKRTGARIVNCCGFDSVPMDIGAWFLQREATERHGVPCSHITLLVRSMRGGASGGTMASMMNIMREARADRDTARVLANPYSLNPYDGYRGPDGSDQKGVRYHDAAGTWTAPFVMATVNTRVVRRSNALLDYAWGRDFRYDEAISTGRGPAGWSRAAMISTSMSGLFLAASFGATRSLLERFLLPKPGEGPDSEARQAGFFNLNQVGVLPDGSLIKSRITGDRDPGYGSTSKMISECAICLASGESTAGGGFLTPSAAMGEPLIARLTENAGLSFEIVS